MNHLPRLNCINRANQHQNIQRQVVPDPKKQNELRHYEENDRTPEAEIPGQNESDDTTGNIAHGVGDRIAFVAQADRYFAIPLNDKMAVFKNFPEAFDADYNPQTPNYAKSRESQPDQAEKNNTMQYMRKAVRIKKVLRTMRTPNVAFP